MEAHLSGALFAETPSFNAASFHDVGGVASFASAEVSFFFSTVCSEAACGEREFQATRGKIIETTDTSPRDPGLLRHAVEVEGGSVPLGRPATYPRWLHDLTLENVFSTLHGKKTRNISASGLPGKSFIRILRVRLNLECQQLVSCGSTSSREKTIVATYSRPGCMQ